VTSVVLDAGVLIGFINSHDAHHDDAVAALVHLDEQRTEMLVSSVTLSEILVGPARVGAKRLNQALSTVRSLVEDRIVRLDVQGARDIAQVRATYPNLRTPNAAVVAAANAANAERILTTDADFDGVPGAIRLGDFAAGLAG
jgi:predicted nucleic acid-binding protein